jgi:predicted RNase H-like nuclease (RuvC/YqgF family)
MPRKKKDIIASEKASPEGQSKGIKLIEDNSELTTSPEFLMALNKKLEERLRKREIELEETKAALEILRKQPPRVDANPELQAEIAMLRRDIEARDLEIASLKEELSTAQLRIKTLEETPKPQKIETTHKVVSTKYGPVDTSKIDPVTAFQIALKKGLIKTTDD